MSGELITTDTRISTIRMARSKESFEQGRTVTTEADDKQACGNRPGHPSPARLAHNPGVDQAAAESPPA